uniref:Ig-like domain-containing protein n=1 Tax=Anopheles atroparvus TaxID=41427 RepID=A0A182JET8_ANOAO
MVKLKVEVGSSAPREVAFRNRNHFRHIEAPSIGNLVRLAHLSNRRSDFKAAVSEGDGTVRCEFQFTVTPQSRQVFEGEPVTFECRALFDDEIDFSWTLNGNPVPAHDRQEAAANSQQPRRIYQSGSNLHIRAVNGTLDRGDYVCLATAGASGARVASPAARLDIIACPDPEDAKITTISPSTTGSDRIAGGTRKDTVREWLHRPSPEG